MTWIIGARQSTKSWLLDTLAIEIKLHNTCIYQYLEQVDKKITFLLNKVRRRIEGPNRGILFYKKKSGEMQLFNMGKLG